MNTTCTINCGGRKDRVVLDTVDDRGSTDRRAKQHGEVSEHQSYFIWNPRWPPLPVSGIIYAILRCHQMVIVPFASRCLPPSLREVTRVIKIYSSNPHLPAQSLDCKATGQATYRTDISQVITNTLDVLKISISWASPSKGIKALLRAWAKATQPSLPGRPNTTLTTHHRRLLKINFVPLRVEVISQWQNR